jgi:hypothetical protein
MAKNVDGQPRDHGSEATPTVRLERTIRIQFSLGEGLDVGMDIGSPIDFTYELPFAFTGKIERVEIKLGPVASATAK